MSHDDAVRARFAATAEGVAAHAREQIEMAARGAAARSSRRCAATSARSTRARARARSRSRSRRSSARSSASISFPSCSRRRARDAPAERDVRRRRRHRAAVRELLVRPRVLAAHAPPREPAGARASRSSRASRRPGGRVFVDDQLAPIDPLAAFELDRFERRRDPSHNRTLSDGDFRDLFATNGLDARPQQALHAPARARLLPRPRRLHRRGRRAREGRLARRPRALRRRVGWYLCAKR